MWGKQQTATSGQTPLPILGALLTRPPTFSVSVSLAPSQHTRVGFRDSIPPPHHSAPWGDSACTTRVIHFKAAYFPSPTGTKGPDSPVSSTYTPPPHQFPYPRPLPHPTAQGGARVCRGSGPPAPTPYHTSPAKPRPGPTLPHPPAPPPRALTWKPATLPPTSLLRVCKPNSGRRPFCRALLCQRRSDPVAGAECATGQNGGMAFLVGGDDVSSASLGRMGYLRAGAGQILYFRGGKGIGK